MAQSKCSSPEGFLHELFPPSELRQAAIGFGVLRRRRKIDPVALVTAVVLTVCGRGGHCMAELHRSFTRRTGVKVARSVFVKRFSLPLEKLVSWMLARLQARACANRPKMRGVLAPFVDVECVDATVIKVRKSLVSLFPGVSSTAAIKVHTRIRALTGELLSHSITAERRHDSKELKIGRWVKGVLYLLDRGYADGSLYWRIHRLGGCFLTPLKKTFTARVVEVNPMHSGSKTRALGQSVWELGRSRGRRAHRVDVICHFQVKVRAHKDSPGRCFMMPFRVVGLWNKAAKRYHFHVTNVPAEQLSAEDCAQVYRIRWQVELLYAVGKSTLGLGELGCRKAHNVNILVQAALIRASITMQARTFASRFLPIGRWIGARLWAKVWLPALMSFLDAYANGRRSYSSINWADLAIAAMDPNKKRVPIPILCCVGD